MLAGLAPAVLAWSAKPASENHASPKRAWAAMFSSSQVKAVIPLAMPA